MNRVALAFATVVILAATPLASFQAGVTEVFLRRRATTMVRPEYPAASLAAKRSGVVVAAVESDTAGKMRSVTILEAPDDAMADAVRKALEGWVVEPTIVSGRPERHGLRGKLTFYFRIGDGRGRVTYPEEMPGGPTLEPPGPPPSRPPGVVSGPPTGVSHGVDPSVEIGEDDWLRVAKAERPTLLDIRDRAAFARGHRDGAVNIPLDEIVIRAALELDKARTVVIDCERETTARCHRVQRDLTRANFARVLMLLP